HVHPRLRAVARLKFGLSQCSVGTAGFLSSFRLLSHCQRESESETESFLSTELDYSTNSSEEAGEKTQRCVALGDDQ
ncbi:uncharacterized, partial [Tachysurus ichikawai]